MMNRTEFKARLEAINHNFGIHWEERDRQRDALFAEYHRSLEVGDHASVRLYTDENPCTVIRKTKTTITVRYDKAERDPNWKPEWITGGFSAICTNDHDQRWIITEDPDGATETFHWSSREGCYIRHGCKVTPEWRKYYDYNF